MSYFVAWAGLQLYIYILYIYTPKWEALLALMFMHIFFIIWAGKTCSPRPLHVVQHEIPGSFKLPLIDRGKRIGRRARQSPSSPLSCPRNKWLPWATEDGVIGFYRKPGMANWKKMMEHYNYVLRLARSAEFVLQHRVWTRKVHHSKGEETGEQAVEFRAERFILYSWSHFLIHSWIEFRL